MKTSRYTEAQIIAILRQAKGGVPVTELCRDQGMMPLPSHGLSSNYEGERRSTSGVRKNGCVDDRPDEGP